MRTVSMLMLVLALIPAFAEEAPPAGMPVALCAKAGTTAFDPDEVKVDLEAGATGQIADTWTRHYVAARESREAVLALLTADLVQVGKNRRLSDEEMAPISAAAKALFGRQTPEFWGCAPLKALLPHLSEAVRQIAPIQYKYRDDRLKVCAVSLAIRESLARAYTARLVADNSCPPPCGN